MKKLILILGIFMVGGCTNNIINSNAYYQTNYDSECLRSGITWSDLILCQQKDLENEWAQNKITNDLLDNNGKN